MSISSAKVVGEISPGFITIVLNPDMTGTDAVNNTGSELIATLPMDIVPPVLREADTDIWFASERLRGGSKKHIKNVFSRTSDDIPEEYYLWLEAYEINKELS